MSVVPTSEAVDAGAVEALPSHVEALLHESAYPHPASGLRLHETHISWVVLAGAYAYKVKKPVSFGFLDFSTLERREAACAEEVRLNRRLAPDVYLGVEHIVERNGAYQVGGPGRAVEPVVWMRRLPAEGMLSYLLAHGAGDIGLVRRIARRLAAFHARAASGPGVNEYGRLEMVTANWRENFEQTEPFVDQVLSRQEMSAIKQYVEGFLADQGTLLERRVEDGRIREGHGDLHASSICVENGVLHFFDCLEFNPRFRCADVAAEVAFLAMDLNHYERPDLAEAFVQAYVRTSGDRELLELLDFYCCYRAYVRAKVLCLRLTEPGLSPEQGARVVDDARHYFDLALSYAQGSAPSRPRSG